MAKRRSHKPAWRRAGSPIGQGPRKAHPKYKRHANESWSDGDVGTLRRHACANTPTELSASK
jgi:hypothetical protein